ncbi:MAG: hypothetical protein LBC05_01870 [Endomicrobium sp.]|nr:hypothetical protein [Endomicrobium sp.]
MFEDILGQQKVKEIISNQIKNNKISHAYIFMGQDGIGKRLIAIEFAKILNCDNINELGIVNKKPCKKCISCKEIAKDIHPNLHFIDFAKQSELEQNDLAKQKNLKIETIRYMQKKVATKIETKKWKIFIIDPAEKMNISAANSLLKTLEEPPKNTVTILISKHKETIPQTIVSRTQVLFFQPLSDNEILSLLTSKNYFSSTCSAEIEKIIKLSEGSIGNAIKLINENKKDNLCLWHKFKSKSFYISDILELSKSISKNDAIKSIALMTVEMKQEFRIYPGNTVFKMLELLNTSRSLLLKNINVRIVLDNLFFDLLALKKDT